VVQRGRDKPLTKEEIYLSLEPASIWARSTTALALDCPYKPAEAPSPRLAAGPDLAIWSRLWRPLRPDAPAIARPPRPGSI
jgi:hypothetical protein